jgi:hypothetical protein
MSYDPFFYQMYVKKKWKVEKPLEFVVSYEPWAPSIHDQTHFLQQGYQEWTRRPTFHKYHNKLDEKL